MDYVFKYFEDLHKIPEIGMHEFKTSAYIADHLKKMGYEVHEHIGGGTGVVAIYDSGKPGPVLGLRADMDALGTKDGGAAHLCGHDVIWPCFLLLPESSKNRSWSIKAN